MFSRGYFILRVTSSIIACECFRLCVFYRGNVRCVTFYRLFLLLNHTLHYYCRLSENEFSFLSAISIDYIFVPFSIFAFDYIFPVFKIGVPYFCFAYNCFCCFSLSSDGRVFFWNCSVPGFCSSYRRGSGRAWLD